MHYNEFLSYPLTAYTAVVVINNITGHLYCNKLACDSKLRTLDNGRYHTSRIREVPLQFPV